MSYFVDTSYGEFRYAVVAVTEEGVILRPLYDGDNPIPSYWNEFIGMSGGGATSDTLLTVHLSSLPQEVLSVNAYVEYDVEYPRVEIHVGDRVVDVSDKVTCNHPNPETPGLYALDFMLSTDGGAAIQVWRSWVSINEPPVLRRIITPWNRDNRIIADLNRLVVEPQFFEALYEAGVPLYNFQQANAPAAVSSCNVMGYRSARSFVKDGKLFISGPRLPVGTEVSIGGVARTLGVRMMSPQFRQASRYVQGDVVSYGGYDYYALVDIPRRHVAGTDTVSSVIPGSVYEYNGSVVECWLRGTYYNIDTLGMASGERTLDSLWGVVDVGGYLFKMDLLRAFPVNHYWGLYDKKYFYDYAPGDLVSVVSNNVISIYQRNETSIAEKGMEESYNPGHYMNPHWVEVYSASNGSVLRDSVIVPYSNAANAVVSKTCPVREEAFRIYAKLVGMPTELVSALGSKYSVLLWALLYRTRETFPGFRAAMRAIGMDVADLHRETPSVIYSSGSGEIANVYDEISAVKRIARSVKADKVWYGTGSPDLSERDPRNTVEAAAGIPWIRYSNASDGVENADAVWEYDTTTYTWRKIYSFRHIGSDRSPLTYDFSVNNRYYKATVNLLDRLARDCVVDLNDGRQRVDHNFVGGVSSALVELLSYEIPIYIYFRLRMSLVAIGHASVRGVSSGVVLHDTWGGTVGFKLYPGRYFDLYDVAVKSVYPTVLYAYVYPDDDSGWTEYTDYRQLDGFRYFAFEQPVYLRLRYEPLPSGVELEEVEFTPSGDYVPVEDRNGKWVSQFTIGCLGDASSPGTGNYGYSDDPPGYTGFKDATCMPSGSDLYLCKGIAAATMRISQSSLSVEAECLQWQYALDGEYEPTGEPALWGNPAANPVWDSDDTAPRFAGWVPTDANLLGYWSGDVGSFVSAVARITCSDGELPFEWDTSDGTVLLIGGTAHRSVFLWNATGYILGMLQLGYVDNLVQDVDASEYWARVSFTD